MKTSWERSILRNLVLTFDQFRFCKQEVSKCLDRSDGFGSWQDVEVVCISPEKPLIDIDIKHWKMDVKMTEYPAIK